MEGRNISAGLPAPGMAGVTRAPGVPAVAGGTTTAAPDYDRFVADVWVCVALTLMILSCVGLLCSCMLYHKLQQWKQHAERAGMAGEEDRRDSLPSYTLVTGLPTYEQAVASEIEKPEARCKSAKQSSPQTSHNVSEKS